MRRAGRIVSRAALAAILAFWAMAGAAQTPVDDLLGLGAGGAGQADADATPEEPQSPPPEPSAEELAAAPDTLAEATGEERFEGWEEVAVRAEETIAAGRASSAALGGLRSELAEWRDIFLSAQDENAARIETVESQLAALTPPADGGEEAPAVALRRNELQAQLESLRAPRLLIQEAFARSNGMIGEIDGIVRSRQRADLSARGPSPLLPAAWVAALDAIGMGLRDLEIETREALASDARRAALGDRLGSTLLLGVAGLIILIFGRRWVFRLRRGLSARRRMSAGVVNFVVSLGEIAVPFLGLVALTQAVVRLNLLGFTGQTLVAVLPLAVLAVLLPAWLATHYFPEGDGRRGLLDMGEETRTTCRRTVRAIGFVIALRILLDAILLRTLEDDAGLSVVVLLFQLLIAGLLFRLGRILAGPMDGDEEDGDADEAEPQYRHGLVRLVGQALTLVAIAGPVLAVLGYGTAAQALVYPAILTAALFAILALLQRFVTEFYGLLTRSDSAGTDALIPVIIGFVLVLLALPVLALIWGARVADLTELWARFREGFALGETRISPTDFITFAIVFTIGYMTTRLVQGALKSSVLPKTRLDIGGQNAVVSGVGYIGIFLAAIIAITSAGINLSSLAIVAGALSVGIGFGLQNIVQNFVSGIILLIERPISEGDWIQVGDQMGYVRDISVRSTRIETFDRTDVIVPNGDLVSGQVTNWTRGNAVGRAIVPVGVAYGTDTKKVEAILREVAEASPMVILNPPPAVLFTGFGADSLDFEIRAILRDVNYLLATKSDMNHAIARRFEEEGIEIPFAQRDIWLRNPEVLKGDTPPGNAPEAPAAAPIPPETDAEGESE